MAKALTLSLTSEQVSALIVALPEAARQAGSGLAYADGVLTVPGDFAADAKAFMAQPGWDAPPDPKIGLIAHLKMLRWQAEIAGVTVTMAGEEIPVSTARGDDRSALHQAFSAIQAGLRPDPATFNFADGRPRLVGNTDMLAAVMASVAHVQGAFDAETKVTASIENGELTTLEDVATVFAAAVA